MAEHNDFGKEAENAAANFLLNNGYQIITRNFRHQKAEIDIIAKKDNLLCIVEVKARSTDTFLEPQEAVNKKKIKMIVAATDAYIEETNETSEVRFDIITVIPNKSGGFIINHIENAFESIDAV